MTEHKKTPELRFSNFLDMWHIHKLSDVATITGGGTPSTKVSEYWDGEIDWYTPNEIGERIYARGSKKKITNLGYKKSSTKLLPINTILFTSRAGIGNTAILAKEGCTNQGFQSIIPNSEKIDSYFIYTISNYIKKYALKHAAGSTFLEISGKELGKMKLFLPSLKEQQKIGVFFSKLDRQIELEEEKLELLEQQKRGYMQKIFSQKLRFKDENGDEYPEWKSKKLKDIANVYQPQNLSQNNFQKKGYPVYGANGVIGYYKDFNHSNMEIAVACRDNTCGRVNLTEPKSWITSNAMVVNIIDKMEIEFYFLYQYLRIINYSNVISGSGQPQITRKNMNSVELLVPNYIEQQKIGNLFRRFDNFIEKQSQKIDLLKERKKGFLQKMFV